MAFKVTGEDFVNVIIARLKDEDTDVLLYDAVILRKIRNLTNGQVWQITGFGDVQDWHNERVNKKSVAAGRDPYEIVIKHTDPGEIKTAKALKCRQRARAAEELNKKMYEALVKISKFPRCYCHGCHSYGCSCYAFIANKALNEFDKEVETDAVLNWKKRARAAEEALKVSNQQVSQVVMLLGLLKQELETFNKYGLDGVEVNVDDSFAGKSINEFLDKVQEN